MEDAFGYDREMMISVFRWFARVIGVLFGGVALFFLIGENIEAAARSAVYEPPTLQLAIFFGLVVTLSVAMLLAVIRKWERPAVLVGVAAILASHVMHIIKDLVEYPFHLNLESFGNLPLSFFWGPILLYLLCWWLERRNPRPRAEASLPDTA
jgi:hypothetical protein